MEIKLREWRKVCLELKKKFFFFDYRQKFLTLWTLKNWWFFSNFHEFSPKSAYIPQKLRNFKNFFFRWKTFLCVISSVSIILIEQIPAKILLLKICSLFFHVRQVAEDPYSEIPPKITILHREIQNLRRFFSESYLEILSTWKLILRIQRIFKKKILKFLQLLGHPHYYICEV